MAKTMQPGYWAVLPANVRYDRSLTTTAKLLYAEISSLAQIDGYCWATDKYFAELFLCSEATITRAMKQLTNSGYIRAEKAANNRGTERHIFCGVFGPKGGTVKNDGTLDGTLTGDGTPTVKNDGTPPSTPINRNNKRGNTRARGNEVRGEVREEFSAFVCEAGFGEDSALFRGLMDFAKNRAKIGKSMESDLAARRLTKKLLRLSGGRVDVMVAMLDKAIELNWTSIYPLRPDELPGVLDAHGGTVEESSGVKTWTPGGGSDE